jgi:hypothetical protein
MSKIEPSLLSSTPYKFLFLLMFLEYNLLLLLFIMKNSDEQRKIPYSFIIFLQDQTVLFTMVKIGKIGEGWRRAEGRRVGPLEVGGQEGLVGRV